MTLLRLLMQTVLLALGQIWANKVRAMLTTLGIIIGVAAVIATVASTTGLKRYVLSELETFGAKKVYIDGFVPPKLRGTLPWPRTRISLQEVAAIRKVSSLEAFTPMYYSGYEIRAGDAVQKAVQVVGIWPDWHAIEQRSITSGRPFSSIDEEQRRQVCVINDRAIQDLSLPKEPVGQNLLIGGRRFLIVGVVETKELPAFLPGGGEVQAEVYVPFSTAFAMNPNRGWVHFVLANLKDVNQAEDAIAEIGFTLRKNRNLQPADEDTFQIRVVQQAIDQFNRIGGAITAGAAGIVAISLLVGGIGIMNIMLVSVSERTREIGLRKAVGARAEVILLQFLVEAIVLCLVGGAVGISIGQGLAGAISHFTPLKEATVPAWAVMLAVGFSAFTGIVFGMFPAIKAARLDPIEALRHE